MQSNCTRILASASAASLTPLPGRGVQTHTGCFISQRSCWADRPQGGRHRDRTRLVVQASKIHSKYRSRREIEEALRREWRETTGRDNVTVPLTLASALAYVPAWLKYNVVPEIFRYMWWLVWVRLAAVLKRVRRSMVLRGAALDVALARRGGGGGMRVDRRRVLQRWHRNVSVMDDLRYRFDLLRGVQQAQGGVSRRDGGMEPTLAVQ